MGPTIAYISHKNLTHNIRLIREAVGGRKIMAVVKANAYGHGDIEVARTAVSAGCEYLGVAFFEEGIKLRRAGLSLPILVFGAHSPAYFETAIEHQLEITITSGEQINFLRAYCKGLKKTVSVHCKVDTGMNRVGLPLETVDRYLSDLLDIKNVLMKGVYSHLATADEADQSYAMTQINRFKDVVSLVNSRCPYSVLFHIANSAAIMNLPDAYFDMVRPGIMLYGQPPSPQFPLQWDLREVMSLRSRLGLIKYVRKGEPISYGRRFYTGEDTHIGVIPAGYADGLNRRLTNQAEVLINNERYPLVGTICMDMVMVNLGKSLRCKTGDEVIFYGQDNKQKISVCDISKKLETIPYEITCSVSSRVPRTHI
jgi:alanine racemase